MKTNHCIFFLAIGLVGALPALAQTGGVPWLAKGTVEVAGFGGFTSGLGQTGGGVGANVGVAANQYLLPYFEVTYFPSLASSSRLYKSANPGSTLTLSDAKLNYTDFQGGIHLRAPNVFHKSNVMPYLSLGVGVLHNGSLSGTLSGSVNGIQIPSTNYTVNSENNFAASFGGGLRIYTKNKVGFRIEVQGFKPTGSNYGNDPFVKVTFGVFFYANNK